MLNKQFSPLPGRFAMLRILLVLLILSLPALGWAEETQLTLQKVHTYATEPHLCVAVSPNGKWVAAGEYVQMEGGREVGRSGVVTLVDVEARESRQLALPALTDGQRVADDLAFTPDSRHLVVAMAHNPLFPAPACVEAVVFECTTGTPLSQFQVHNKDSGATASRPSIVVLRNVEEAASQSAVSSPLFVVSIATQCFLGWFDEAGFLLQTETLPDLKRKVRFPRRDPMSGGGVFNDLAASPDKRLMALTVGSYGLVVYKDGKPFKVIRVPALPVSGCAVNTTGTLITVVSKDGAARLYSPAGVLKKTLNGDNIGGSPSFSPYGDKLAFAKQWNTTVFDLASESSAEVKSGGWDVAWAPDGESVYAVGRDGLTQLVLTDPEKAASIVTPPPVNGGSEE